MIEPSIRSHRRRGGLPVPATSSDDTVRPTPAAETARDQPRLLFFYRAAARRSARPWRRGWVERRNAAGEQGVLRRGRISRLGRVGCCSRRGAVAVPLRRLRLWSELQDRTGALPDVRRRLLGIPRAPPAEWPRLDFGTRGAIWARDHRCALVAVTRWATCAAL